MEPLKGKIYWVEDTFSYEGIHKLKGKESWHIVSKIENVIIDEHLIKFLVLPHIVNLASGEQFSYNVNLIPNETGMGFTGSFSEASDSDWSGEVTCERFENSKKIMLYGRWIEDSSEYTWWAIIDK